MIMKVQHTRSREFSILLNQTLQDPELSAKAKGIWAYCMSLPDDWKINIEELAEHFSNQVYSIRKGLEELEREGYLQRHRIQRGWVTTLFETKQKKKATKEADVIDIGVPLTTDFQSVCEKLFGEVTSKGKKVIQLSNDYICEQKKNYPNRVHVTPKTIEEGAMQLEKACRIDGYLFSDLKLALLGVAEDCNHFWNKNLYTLSTLRKKCRNGRTKLQNIMDHYEDEAKGNETPSDLPEKTAQMIDTCPLHGEDKDKYGLIGQLSNQYNNFPDNVRKMYLTNGGVKHFIKRYWSFFDKMKKKVPHCKNAGTQSKFYNQFLFALQKESGISHKTGRRV